MKTYKIFALPSHVTKERMSGVDYARVVQPMTHLNGFKYGGNEFKVDIYDIHAKVQPNWIQVSKDYDLVFLNYTVLDWAFAAMGAPLRGEGKKMIIDLDDAIWYVRRDNPTYEQYHADNGRYINNVRCILDEVDHIVCTSRFLRNVIVDKTYRRHEHITVIPNCIDFKMYNHKYDAIDRGTITITHFGSTTHFEDLLQKEFTDGITRIMEEFPNVRFLTVGAFIPEFRYKFGARYENAFGSNDIYKWIKDKFPSYMKQSDIVVAPLEIDNYNKSKSFIKYLEYSSAKRPGVYQDIIQYQEIVDHGKNGYLAETSDDWYESIKKLMDIRSRTKMGYMAYKTASKYQIEDYVSEYAKVIIDTLTG